MKRLWVKLTVAFLITALVAVGVVAALAVRATGTQFRQYVVRANMMGQPGLVQSLVEFYAARGSWEGIDTILANVGQGMGMMGRGRGRAGTGVALTDADGRVVYSASGELLGQRLSAAALAQGISVALPDGQQVGTLLSLEPASAALDEQGQAFLDRVGQSLLWAGLLAVAVALLLGLLISRQLTAPLRRLTDAAGAVAAGDLTPRVQPTGGDEIGELGRAFNVMASSLQQGEMLRRNLMADVAHELRTPLTVIQGNLQAMLDGVYPLDVGQIASLHDETRLLTRLVEDLRELALAEAGQLRLERGLVDCGALARSAAANFAPAAEAAGITLVAQVAPMLPAVDGDPDRLSQVLRNLLSNALRHTPAGGRITVRVERADRPATLLCRVDDTGTGIAAEDLPHVFDRFYRGEQGHRGSGAGLGLAIARQFVLAHGGDIDVQSTVGQGTQFTVRLPVAGERPGI